MYITLYPNHTHPRPHRTVMSTSLLIPYMASPYICYGAGPVLAAAFGFLTAWALCALLEVASCEGKKITYGNNSPLRKDEIKKTQLSVPYSEQLTATLMTLLGPGAVLNCCLSAVLIPRLMYTSLEDLPLVPSLETFILQLVSCYVIGDLGLYLGHRIQHENEWLWTTFHSFHHKLKTPAAVSTIYIHPIDMLLQASLPMLLAVFVTQAHPLVFAAYSFSRVAENTFNHSGLDSFVVRLVTLKFLPGRASVRHHDEHHRYSGYSGNAKNYGEGFWIWDGMMGTSRKSTVVVKKKE